MDTFTPLFSKVVQSSLWDETDLVVKVYMTMLAMKDPDHVVRATAYGIAREARKTEAEVLEVLRVLSLPDQRRLEPQEFDGRRIERVSEEDGGGWLILNGAKYQRMMAVVFRRARNAEAMRRARALKKLGQPLPGEVGYCRVAREEGLEAADAMQGVGQEGEGGRGSTEGKGTGDGLGSS